ncbi:MAG: hypothetical protein R2939_12190 [Kofleriaceae bacterium]
MPQVTEFPPFGTDGRAAIAAIVRVCRETPAAGEPARGFRARLKAARLWDAERPTVGATFFDVPASGTVVPSTFMRAVADAGDDDAVAATIIERLWACNPPMAAAILAAIDERPHGKDELGKLLGSAAYRGTQPSRPGLETWLQLALALGILRQVGIAVAPGPRRDLLAAHAEGFEVDEYLAEDAAAPATVAPVEGDDDDAVPTAVAGTPSTAVETSIPVAAAAPAGPGLPIALRHLASAALPPPLGRDRAVPPSAFMPTEGGAGVFDGDVLDETARRLQAWWKDAGAPAGGFAPEDFGLDPEAWVEGADELLYRVAVAAALVFRLEASRDSVIAAFRALDDAGVLADLYHGTVPETLPAQVDARALMLASLAARRCAEAPELAASLEREPGAAARFAVLERALGRGLFRIELLWIVDQLARLGVLRGDGLADLTTTPYRVVRDTLYRLGAIATPYAPDADALLAAARAARRLAGDAVPEELLAGFALAAGCRFDCPHRKACDFPCRERLE